MATSLGTMTVRLKFIYPWFWRAMGRAACVVAIAAIFALCIAGGQLVAWEIARVESHEAAILVLERHAEETRQVMRAKGWAVEQAPASQPVEAR